MTPRRRATLLARSARANLWTVSALTLPLVSLGVAYGGVNDGAREGLVLALWTGFAFGAWQFERRARDHARAGAHLLAASALGCLAVTAWLWGTPLYFAAGLATWGVLLAVLGKDEDSALPIAGVALALGASVLTALDQLASRVAYAYTPLMTRSSASAACAAVGRCGWARPGGGGPEQGKWCRCPADRSVGEAGAPDRFSSCGGEWRWRTPSAGTSEPSC